MLSEETGVNKGGGMFDGFSVSCREIADLDKGNGSNSGYCMFRSAFIRLAYKGRNGELSWIGS